MRGVPDKNTSCPGSVKHTDAAAGCPEVVINLAEVHKPVVLATFDTGIGVKGHGPSESGCKYNSTGCARPVLFMLKKLRCNRRFKILLRDNTPQLEYRRVHYFFILKFSLLFKIIKASNTMLKNKLMLPILAVIVGVAASAFTAPKNTGKIGTTYFQYTGTSTAGYTNASNWNVASQPFDGCIGQVEACTVHSTTITTVAGMASYCASNNPQVSNGSVYQIDSQEAAFPK